MKIFRKETTTPSTLDKYRTKRKAWWWFVLVPVLGVGVWYLSTLFIAVNRLTAPKTTSGSSVLKEANNGEGSKPINILLIGIGGASHPGGTLADSIMVASIDIKHQAVSFLSIPRDLYVTIPGIGKEKINAAHSLGEMRQSQKGGGPALLQQTVSQTLGVPIHYFIRVDFDGFKEIVDSLGGVTVNVKTALNDPFFPDAKQVGYEPFSISAGIHKLDGKTALKYSRSRETTSDLDRARRQQEVLLAIKDKVFTTEVLANPKKVTSLITAVGKHMLTDFSPTEIEDVVKLAKQLDNPAINREVLGNGDNALLVSSRSANGASILIPAAGASDFSQIQLFAQGYLAAPAIKSEKASIRIDKASGVTKEQAAKVQKQLEWAGFTVSLSDQPLTTAAKTTLSDASLGKKPASLDLLGSAYNLTPKKDEMTTSSDFVLTIGSDFTTATKAKVSSTTAPSSSALSSTTKSQSSSTPSALGLTSR